MSAIEDDNAQIATDALILWTMKDPVGIRENEGINTDEEDEVEATRPTHPRRLTRGGGVVVVAIVLAREASLLVLVS